MEYYSAIKTKEILPFATTRMKLEGIKLSEIYQTEKDKYCMISLICGILKKKKNLIETKNRLVVARGKGWGMGEMAECGQRVYIASYKVNKFWGCNIQHDDYS